MPQSGMGIGGVTSPGCLHESCGFPAQFLDVIPEVVCQRRHPARCSVHLLGTDLHKTSPDRCPGPGTRIPEPQETSTVIWVMIMSVAELVAVSVHLLLTSVFPHLRPRGSTDFGYGRQRFGCIRGQRGNQPR